MKKIEMALGLRKDGIGLSDFELLSVVGKGAAGMVYAVSVLVHACAQHYQWQRMEPTRVS